MTYQGWPRLVVFSDVAVNAGLVTWVRPYEKGPSTGTRIGLVDGTSIVVDGYFQDVLWKLGLVEGEGS